MGAGGEEDGGQKFGDGEILFPVGVTAHTALEARAVGGEQRNAVACLRDVFGGLNSGTDGGWGERGDGAEARV